MQDKTVRTLVQGLILSLLPAGAALAGPVNLNSADAATLARELDGIGPAKAQAIVEFRQQNGPFKSAEDLLKVDGIGERVLEQNRGNIDLRERNNEVRAQIANERQMSIETQNKIANLVEKFNTLMDQQRFAEAEGIAKQVRELEPERHC